jgi:hypothetical protein
MTNEVFIICSFQQELLAGDEIDAGSMHII